MNYERSFQNLKQLYLKHHQTQKNSKESLQNKNLQNNLKSLQQNNIIQYYISKLTISNLKVIQLYKQISRQQLQQRQISQPSETNQKKKSKFQKIGNLKQHKKNIKKNHQSHSNNTGKLLYESLYKQIQLIDTQSERLFNKCFVQKSDKAKLIINDQVYMMLIKSYCLLLKFKLFLASTNQNIQANQANYSSIQNYLQSLSTILKYTKTSRSNLSQKCVLSSSSMTKFCLRQILALKSIKQYQYYNSNSNQQFKYGAITQMQFLSIVGTIKSAGHLNLLDFKNIKQEELKIIISIYKQGKQSLQNCIKLQQKQANPLSAINIRPDESSNKKQPYPSFPTLKSAASTILTYQLTSQTSKNLNQIIQYLKWIQKNWLKQIFSSPNTFKKQNNQQIQSIYININQNMQNLPQKYMNTYYLFFIIHKLAQFQQLYGIQEVNQTKKQINRNQKPGKQNLKVKASQVRNRILDCMNRLKYSKEKTSVHETKNAQSYLLTVFNMIQRILNMNLVNSSNDDQQIFKLQKLLNHPSLIIILQKLQKNHKVNQIHAPNTQLKPLSKALNQQFVQKTIFKREQTQKLTIKEQSQSATKSQKESKSFKKILVLEKQQKPQKKQSIKNNLSQNKSQISQEPVRKVLKFEEKVQIFSNTKMVTPRKSNNLFQISSLNSQSNNIKNIFNVIKVGQYLTKFNYGNNSYANKFVKLSAKADKIIWGDSKEQIEDDHSQYKITKINGIVYGDVTQKLIYQCQKGKSKNTTQPWRCFSLICHDRTLDFYCHLNQYDIFFWLIGMSYHLKSKFNRLSSFSRGKILWKKCLMKFRLFYSNLPDKKQDKKNKNNKFYLGKANAKAIVNFGRQMKRLEKSQKSPIK